MAGKSNIIVIDTNIFINPEARDNFGSFPQQAFSNFLSLLEKSKNISCYIPPTVYSEIAKFIDLNNIKRKKLALIKKKSPSKYELKIPALLFYEFIEETRLRINKGLRIAEKYSRQELADSPQQLIKTLREEYRRALREGILDSKEDVDLILLAKEIKGKLATTDKGLIKWAQKLGIICLNAQELKEILQNQPAR